VTKTAIPSAPSELEELLNDSKRVEQVMKDGQFGELVTAYARNVMNKDKDLSAQIEEQTQLALANLLQQEKGSKDVKRLNHALLENRNAIKKGTGAIRNAAYNPNAPAAALDGTYDGLGDFALDVYKANKTGAKVGNPEAWNKVVELSNSYSETDPGTGGFLVPEETRSELLTLALEQSVIRSRATVITMNSLTTKIPFVDETTHSGSVFGGMVFYWVGESATITATEARFGSVKLEANKLVGGARIPNELWGDAPALRTWLEANAPRGLAFFEDQAFINGNGVGQPFGFLRSPALVQYDRATTDVYALSDIVGMYARMLPSSLGSAVWLVNQTALPQLFALNTGTGGYPLGVVNIADKPMFTLLGRPLVVTEKMPALANSLGNEIAFVDLSYYLVGDRQAISMDFSEHSRFMNDETELRLIERVDGRPWIQSALTPVHGDTLSPFVGISDT
jgi:HK97 family phage major capsid protein